MSTSSPDMGDENRGLSGKTLLVITPDYPDKDNRYIGSLFVKDQVEHLKPFFKEILVVCPILFSFGIMPNDRYCFDYRYDNVSVFYPRAFFIPRIAPFLPYRLKLHFDLRHRAVINCIRKHSLRFDLIHAQFSWPSAYCASLLKETCHIPYVITAHEDPSWLKEEMDLHNPRMDRAWADADRIIYMNSLEVPKLKKYNPSTICIPTGYEPVYYPHDVTTCRDALHLPKDSRILFTFGNLQKRKGLEYLIEAMDIIRGSHTDVHCYIGGQAEYEKSYESFLKRRVKDLNTGDKVHFIGFLAAEDIPLWLNACDLFMLPSLEEGFGRAQIEALACGKPVIAARNTGSMDILTDPDVGILCECADSRDLARGIEEALARTWDREKILTFAAKYKAENVVQNGLSVYRQVLSKNTSGNG